ncbi:hypothetical protein ACIA8O_36085 [Kitasatospora sp. NPDC051853]|uniref:hypothetical protein n=1 Tax=Kitasatospora sp. NPDC051853 TaxID=3364058 RepID=UPI0037AD320B
MTTGPIGSPAMRRARTLPLVLLLALSTTACTADTDGRFDAHTATPSPTCIRHQSHDPGTDYTAGQQADPRAVLEMMRFYTANGTKAYCDNQPPTTTDQHWNDLYTQLGGDPHNLLKPQP